MTPHDVKTGWDLDFIVFTGKLVRIVYIVYLLPS